MKKTSVTFLPKNEKKKFWPPEQSMVVSYDAFSGMGIVEFWLKFHWCSKDLIDNAPASV